MANRRQRSSIRMGGYQWRVRALFCVSFCVLTSIASLPRVAMSEDAVDGERLFTLRVLPLLKVKCFGCHGGDPDDIRGDYDLLSREGMLAGGESEEPSLVPGDPEASSLYQAILWEGLEMPPKENDRLSEKETEYVRKWIKAGAPWPNEEARRRIQEKEWAVRENEDGVIVDTSGGTADDWTYRRYRPNEIWAFQPVQPVKLPADADHPVDFFVDRKLSEAKIPAAEQAKPRTLVRRAFYDLTGLPPTPEEVDSFVKSWAQDRKLAWSNLLEKLLSSDHYGERAAQHWLDVVRYADTAGFSNDYERSNAWRYRDYVIRSFNNDKPIDAFIIEQLAGDEVADLKANGDASDSGLPPSTLRLNSAELRVATGFLRMGPWGTAMVPQKEARQIYLDDLVHNVGQSFLSMPLRCCKCHDHKFDPLPTRDYYSMYAAFATTQPAEVAAPFLPVENRKGFQAKRQLTKELLEFATAEFDKVLNKQEAAAKAWYAEHNLPYKNENARKNDPEDKKPPRHVGLTPEEKGIMKVRRQDVWIWNRRMERYQPLAQAVYNGQDDYKNSRKLRPAKKVNKKWRPNNFILAGGSLEAPADKVTPGVLSATGLPASTDSPKSPWSLTEQLEGRRLGLARWIADDRNPLTARSFVNRIWQQHFGKGIVKTANNFGVKGAKPTHPELLDWLTHDFVQNGWRVKRLHRLIMTSATYQRASRPADKETQANQDPDNKLLASFPPRRLTAEELRDSTLLVSGELNREMGGVPIMPEINMEVALQPRMIQFSIAPAHQPSRTPAERNRRTIYAYRVRGQADPFLEIMNLPNPNESCEIRDSSAVTPQAFTLLNSDMMTDRSIAFAKRVQASGAKPQDWIRQAVQLAYARTPTAREQKALEAYLGEMQDYHAKNSVAPKSYPTQVTRSLVEEFTGKPFEFIEKLNVFEDYVPDAKPWTVSADTRAIADVCLLLMNSNEFVYVY